MCSRLRRVGVALHQPEQQADAGADGFPRGLLVLLPERRARLQRGEDVHRLAGGGARREHAHRRGLGELGHVGGGQAPTGQAALPAIGELGGHRLARLAFPRGRVLLDPGRELLG